MISRLSAVDFPFNIGFSTVRLMSRKCPLNPTLINVLDIFRMQMMGYIGLKLWKNQGYFSLRGKI